MKKHNFLYILLFSIVFISCEDFFEKEPLGKTYREQFYNNVNDLQLGLNAVYNVLARDDFQKSEWMFGDGCGDDCVRVVNLTPSTDEAKLIQFKFSPDNSLILQRWEVNYLGIYRANQIIANAEKAIDPPDASEANLITEIVAQAKFLRAFFYFNLVKTYGDIPIKPEQFQISDKEDNFTQARAPKEEVYEYIEKDLREAILGLRDFYSKTTNLDDLGKAQKGTATAYLIKVLAYQAENGINHPKWHEALKFCKLIAEGEQLPIKEILNYEELYNNTGWEEIKANLRLPNTDNLETTIGNVFQYEGWQNFPYDRIWSTDGELQPGSIFEVVHVESKDGTWGNNNLGSNLFNSLITNPQICTTFQPVHTLKGSLDPRLKITVLEFGQELEPEDGLEEAVSVARLPDHSSCYKWFVSPADEAAKHASDGRRNFRLMRMGEVILWYAEALNETGNQVKSVQQLNILRERARKVALTVKRATGLDQTTPNLEPVNYLRLRQIIWDERRIELAFEFDRFWDIVRQGNAGRLMSSFNGAFENLYEKDFKAGVNEIFPIPQREIDLSNGTVTQNPGY